MVTFTIPGRLPSANEFIRWDRIRGNHSMRVKFWGAKKRRETIFHVWAYIKRAPIVNFKGPVDIAVRWFEPNAKRDYDNIASGIKFILDALVKAGTIGGDSRKWIPLPVRHEHAVDRVDPRIEVTINEHAGMAGPDMRRPTQAAATVSPVDAHRKMSRKLPA